MPVVCSARRMLRILLTRQLLQNPRPLNPQKLHQQKLEATPVVCLEAAVTLALHLVVHRVLLLLPARAFLL